MTFLIAMQADDSVVLSTDNTLLTAGTDQTGYDKGMPIKKIHHWDNGVLTGSGEYGVVYRMLRHVQLESDWSLLPSRLRHEQCLRRSEVGECEQIDLTQLVLSYPTEHGPRLCVVNSQTTEQVLPGELLVFFPLDYDFLSVPSSAITDLNASLRSKASFGSTREWVDFYIARFAAIYSVQHQHNELISESFHIHFQAKNVAETIFVQQQAIS